MQYALGQYLFWFLVGVVQAWLHYKAQGAHDTHQQPLESLSDAGWVGQRCVMVMVFTRGLPPRRRPAVRARRSCVVFVLQRWRLCLITNVGVYVRRLPSMMASGLWAQQQVVLFQWAQVVLGRLQPLALS